MATSPTTSLVTRAKMAVAQWVAEYIPESIAAKLSGWGEPAQIASAMSIESIQGIVRQAERGNTYQLFALFRDIISNSSHIQTEWDKRVMSVVGKTQSFQPIDKNNADDVQAAEVIEDMTQNCENWLDSQTHFLGGHIWPLSAQEKVFERVRPSDQFQYRHPVTWRLRRLHPVNYALLSYQISYLGSALMPKAVTNGSGNGSLGQNEAAIWNPNDWEPDMRFYSTYDNGQINFSPDGWYKPDPARHVIHRGHAQSGLRDNNGGALTGIAFWWFMGVCGRDWFARFMDRSGNPFPVAYVNSQSNDLIEMIKKAFSQSARMGALILPERSRVELQQVMVSGFADGYEKFIGLCNREISKRLVGQELSTVAVKSGGGFGSGVSDLQGEVRQDIRKWDEKKLDKTNRLQIFQQYLRINGFRGRPPRSVWGGLSSGEALSYAQTLVAVKNAGLRPIEQSLDTISENLGYKVEYDPNAELAAKNGNGNPNDKRQPVEA